MYVYNMSYIHNNIVNRYYQHLRMYIALQMIQVQLLLVQKENKDYQDFQVPLAILEYQDYLVGMEFQE